MANRATMPPAIDDIALPPRAARVLRLYAARSADIEVERDAQFFAAYAARACRRAPPASCAMMRIYIFA